MMIEVNCGSSWGWTCYQSSWSGLDLWRWQKEVQIDGKELEWKKIGHRDDGEERQERCLSADERQSTISQSGGGDFGQEENRSSPGPI